MLQQSLGRIWHPFKGNPRPLASTFYNYGVSVRTWPQTNLAFISTRQFSFSFLLLTTTQDKLMHLGTHWALLVCRGQNLSHKGTACGKDWELSKFSSHKSSNLSHSILQLIDSLLPPLLLYCMLILWLSWETYLFWTSTEKLLSHPFLSLQSIASLPLFLDLMEFLGNSFFSSSFFKQTWAPSPKRTAAKLHRAWIRHVQSLEEGKTVVHCPLMTAFHMYLSHNQCSLSLAMKSGCRSWIWRVGRGVVVAEENVCGGSRVSCAVLDGCSYRKLRVQDFGWGWARCTYNFSDSKVQEKVNNCFWTI